MVSDSEYRVASKWREPKSQREVLSPSAGSVDWTALRNEASGMLPNGVQHAVFLYHLAPDVTFRVGLRVVPARSFAEGRTAVLVCAGRKSY
jgi:hypothetical protein